MIRHKEIIELLEAKVLCWNHMRYLCWPSTNTEVDGTTMVMFVNINELFYPGADAECIENEKDLQNLYDLWSKHKSAGVDIWAIRKRKLQPMESNKEYLVEEGLWCEEFDSYELNNF